MKGKHVKPFGCPVYALAEALQSENHTKSGRVDDTIPTKNGRELMEK